jgi:predicted DNA-binding WGR domain protein
MLELYQLALFPESVTLARIRPEQNERRFYHLEIRPDLFGRTMLVRRWGRIGISASRVQCDLALHRIVR